MKLDIQHEAYIRPRVKNECNLSWQDGDALLSEIDELRERLKEGCIHEFELDTSMTTMRCDKCGTEAPRYRSSELEGKFVLALHGLDRLIKESYTPITEDQPASMLLGRAIGMAMNIKAMLETPPFK